MRKSSNGLNKCFPREHCRSEIARKSEGPVSPYNTTVQKNVVELLMQYNLESHHGTRTTTRTLTSLWPSCHSLHRGQFVFSLCQDTNIVRSLYTFPHKKVRIISINNLFFVAAATDFAFFPLLCIPSDSPPSPPLPNMTGELFLQKNIPEGVTGSPTGLTHSQMISNTFQNRF